jgi:hypothetical protein
MMLVPNNKVISIFDGYLAQLEELLEDPDLFW